MTYSVDANTSTRTHTDTHTQSRILTTSNRFSKRCIIFVCIKYWVMFYCCSSCLFVFLVLFCYSCVVVMQSVCVCMCVRACVRAYIYIYIYIYKMSCHSRKQYMDCKQSEVSIILQLLIGHFQYNEKLVIPGSVTLTGN